MLDEYRDVSQRLLMRAVQSRIENSTVTIETHAKVVNNITRLTTSNRFSGKGNIESLELLKRSIDRDHYTFELDVSTEPRRGDPCPELSVYSYSNNSLMSLNFTDDDDSAYFIIFWDSFYVQSVYYLNNLNKIIDEKPIGDIKINIIAISLDEDRDASQEKFQQASWSNIECYWAGPKRFDCQAAQILQVSTVPTALWVSRGKILWRGNSWVRMIERDFKFFVDFGRPPPNPSILKEGDICPSICLYPSENQSEIAPNIDNKVALMMFWASWSKLSQTPIYELSKEIANRPEWKLDVEFIAISVDKNKYFYENCERDIWPGIKSLWSGPKGFQSPVPSLFSIDRLPFWVLLKEGKIIWKGNPKDKNVVQMIDALLHNRPIPVTPALSRRELISKLELIKLIIQSSSQSAYLSIKSFEYFSSAQYAADGEKEEASCWIYIKTKDKKGREVQELKEKIEEVFSETIIIISRNKEKFDCSRDCLCFSCELL